jgi:prepilin-type N-terminal cleavage/methylation domain-containing protein
MKRPIPVRSRSAVNPGFTLVEILVALALSLLILGAVITMFGKVTESISDSRSLLEMADRLRLAEERLQLDLAGVTVTMNPPRDPANNEGYFEYIEGPIGLPMSGITSIMAPPSSAARNTDLAGSPDDSTVGDFDDILMFTTRSTGRPFVGKFNSGTIQSYVAEVAWFIRGRTLHRRVLLVVPGAFITAPALGFYANNDISVHLNAGGATVTPNTLADLTRRECRFAHYPAAFPSSVAAYWAWTTNAGYAFATLPTLNECSYSGLSGLLPGNAITSPTTLDFWTNNASYRLADNAFIGTANAGTRVSDDIILTNVIGFDVKAWDSGAGAYVDLGYNTGLATPTQFSGLGNGPLAGTANTARVYDTYSTSHFGTAWNDGLDNGGVSGIVDDDSEKINPPPYPVPLRGIQVKIRVFEPDSKQVREVTVVQDFLPR